MSSFVSISLRDGNPSPFPFYEGERYCFSRLSSDSPTCDSCMGCSDKVQAFSQRLTCLHTPENEEDIHNIFQKNAYWGKLELLNKTDPDFSYRKKLKEQYPPKPQEALEPIIPENSQGISLLKQNLQNPGIHWDRFKRGVYIVGPLNQFKQISPVACWKPEAEIRGIDSPCVVPSYKYRLPAKRGIPPEWELKNEVIFSYFYPLNQALIPTPEGLYISYIKGAEHMDFANPSHLNVFDDHSAGLYAIDLLLHNTDRNTGNLLVANGDLYPIDNGLILPAGFKSAANFCWLNAKSSKVPFDEEDAEAILELDFREICQGILWHYPNYPSENLETLRISLHTLQAGVEAGLSPWLIAKGFMCSLFGKEVSFLRACYEKIRETERDPEHVFKKMKVKITKQIKNLVKYSQ